MKASTMICLLLVCSFTLATGAEAQTSADEEAIRSALAGYAEARQRRDSVAQGQFYALDADFGQIGGNRITRGREAIETTLQTPASADESRFALEVNQVRFLSPTFALVDANFAGRRGGGFALYVMAKQGDEWLIKAARVAPGPERRQQRN